MVKAFLRPGMNPTLTVAAVQLEAKMADKEANLRKVLHYIKKAAAKKAEIVVFPEMCLTGYTCGADLEKTSILFELAEPIPGPSANAITKAAKENSIYAVVGMPEANTESLGQIHNSALFTGPEGIVGVYRKIHLVNFPGFPTVRETHWGFVPGTEIPVWKTKQGWKIGVNICYDQGMTEIPRIQALKGADVIICISAGPTELKDAWYMYNQVRAMENTVFIVYSNFVGEQWGKVSFSGGAMVIKPTGEFLAKGPVDKEDMTIAKLEAKTLFDARTAFPALRDRRPWMYTEITRYPLS
jgi:predicted amidohydrolase